MCACAPRRGGAARRRVSSPVWPFSIYQPHGIYVVIPPPSNACISNRVLGRCALKADPTSVPTWHAWADLEERGGHLARAAELRSLGLQERTEAAGASLDLSPGELLRVDLPLMPVLAQLRAWLTRGKATGGGKGEVLELESAKPGPTWSRELPKKLAVPPELERDLAGGTL